jgi:hypothetical protein
MAQREGAPEGTPSEQAVEHDFSMPAEPDIAPADDEAQQA